MKCDQDHERRRRLYSREYQESTEFEVLTSLGKKYPIEN
jgi:hypothetical protein